jgi:hypothetical protein
MDVSKDLPKTFDSLELTQQEINESTIRITEWEGIESGEKLYIKLVN